jgi:hypothetical protein
VERDDRSPGGVGDAVLTPPDRAAHAALDSEVERHHAEKSEVPHAACGQLLTVFRLTDGEHGSGARVRKQPSLLPIEVQPPDHLQDFGIDDGAPIGNHQAVEATGQSDEPGHQRLRVIEAPDPTVGDFIAVEVP